MLYTQHLRQIHVLVTILGAIALILNLTNNLGALARVRS